MIKCVLKLELFVKNSSCKPQVTFSGECKGHPIHSHKRNDDSRKTSPLINHQDTAPYRFLCYLPRPVGDTADLSDLYKNLHDHWFLAAPFAVCQMYSNWFPIMFQTESPPLLYIIYFLPCSLKTEAIVLHKSTVMYICSTPLRFWIQFQGYETFWGNFSTHTLWRVNVFLVSSLNWGAWWDVSQPNVVGSSFRTALLLCSDWHFELQHFAKDRRKGLHGF